MCEVAHQGLDAWLRLTIYPRRLTTRSITVSGESLTCSTLTQALFDVGRESTSRWNASQGPMAISGLSRQWIPAVSASHSYPLPISTVTLNVKVATGGDGVSRLRGSHG